MRVWREEGFCSCSILLIMYRISFWRMQMLLLAEIAALLSFLKGRCYCVDRSVS